MPERMEITCKGACIEQNLNIGQENVTFDVKEASDIDESIEGQDINILSFSCTSEPQGSDPSDKEYAASDLSDMTEVNADDYAEYNALLTEIPIDLKDIYQEFPSEEYAEFMHMLTQFYVQDPLANVFIKFFNKYSNHNDHPLLSTSQTRRTFIENLNLSNFEYVFEHRTMLDGVQQLLMNKSITENFIFKYKSSIKITSNQCQYTDMYDSNWWRNVEQNLPIRAHVMPIILYAY
ncbi:12597_t:CDS:2, partial [Funneliformis caledonium]